MSVSVPRDVKQTGMGKDLCFPRTCQIDYSPDLVWNETGDVRGLKLVPKQTLHWVKPNSDLMWYAAFHDQMWWQRENRVCQCHRNVPCQQYIIAPHKTHKTLPMNTFKGSLEDIHVISVCLSSQQSRCDVTAITSQLPDMYSSVKLHSEVMQEPCRLSMQKHFLTVDAWVRMLCTCCPSCPVRHACTRDGKFCV